jgi:enterochelin esterase-like enzyme
VLGAGFHVGELTIDSRAVGRELEVSVIEPAGAGAVKRPLLILLHFATGSNESFFNKRSFLDGVKALGDEAPVIAMPEGDDSWWHRRRSGDWGRYVVEEDIPAVSGRFDADPGRVAIGGPSMGGFGAYHLALLYQGRFCAVGGHSAGLWLHDDEAFPEAFDDHADFERNDVVAAVRSDPDAFGDIPIWNDYGKFMAGNAAFVAALREGHANLTAHVWPGEFDNSYPHWPQYLRFYAKSLADC